MGIPASASPFVSQLFSLMFEKLLTCWSKVCASASPLQGLCESNFGQRGSSEPQQQNLSRRVLSSGSSPPSTGHLGNAGTRVSPSRTAHSPQNSSRPCFGPGPPRPGAAASATVRPPIAACPEMNGSGPILSVKIGNLAMLSPLWTLWDASMRAHSCANLHGR